jgi:shikimate 5-dehydrogenase
MRIAENKEYTEKWLADCRAALDSYFDYSNKKIVLFGAGRRGKAILKVLLDIGINVAYLVDNNPEKRECETIDTNGNRHSFAVKAPEALCDEKDTQLILLIAVAGALHGEIKQQLCEMRLEELIWDSII